MLFIEKKKDILTMRSFGADKVTLFKIFFYEGLLISGRGVFLGLILGYTVVFLQLQFGFLEMPGTGGSFFPMRPTIKDGILIFSAVAILGILVSYLPSKYLINRTFS
jgi:lipoprotein-releasing system permease protein